MRAQGAEARVWPWPPGLTVPEAGWAGIKNGQLLSLATSRFDAFITTDTNLEHQQTLVKSALLLVLLIAPSNDINALRPLVPATLAALETATKGQLVKSAANYPMQSTNVKS